MCLLTQMDHKANNSRPIADVTDRRSDTANVKELWGHQSMDSFIRLKVEKRAVGVHSDAFSTILVYLEKKFAKS